MSHTILLVDDEANVLEGLTRLLHKEPYVIRTANTAEEAAVLLEDHSVDLIVCDEQMPGISGTEFLARVAQDYPDIVRIVLTGHPSLLAALRAINEGKVSYFLTKPNGGIGLATRIRRALQEKDLTAKSRDLLDVSKRQRTLIEEARLLRRLHGAPRWERAKTIAKRDEPAEPHELLEQMDEEVQSARGLLREVSFLTALTHVSSQA